MPASSTTANTEVSQGPRSELRNRMAGGMLRTVGAIRAVDATERVSVSVS
jgi:hypothetical protein